MGNACVSQNPYNDIANHLPSTLEAYLDRKNREIPQSTTVKVLSYNIFVRPPMINNNGDDYKDERLAEFLKAIHSFDVICLQEMFGVYSSRQEKFIEKAKEIGFLYKAFAPKPVSLSTYFIDGGLLVLSRFPIECVDFATFPNGIGADYYVQKGSLYTKIKVGNSRLHLFSTHAQATYDTTEAYLICRTAQFNTLGKFVNTTLNNQKYNEGDMVLLAGDFNVDGRGTRTYEGKKFSNHPGFENFKTLTSLEAFTEYDALIASLSDDFKDKVEDLIYKNKKEHPITFGDYYLDGNNKKVPTETVLTDATCLCVGESLDYIFSFTPANKSSARQSGLNSAGLNKEKHGLTVIKESAVVQPFLIHGHHFEQLSDHYGVSVTLQYTKPTDNDKEDSDTTISSAKHQSSPVRSLKAMD